MLNIQFENISDADFIVQLHVTAVSVGNIIISLFKSDRLPYILLDALNLFWNIIYYHIFDVYMVDNLCHVILSS